MSSDVVFYEHVFQDTSNETNRPNIYDQFFFTEDQPVLSELSQAILALCDNVENNNNNNCELDIEVPEEVCSHIDQNINEDHDTKQNIESSVCLNEY